MFLPLLVFVGLVAAARSTVNVTINDCPPSLSRTQLRVFGSSCYLFVLDYEREFITAERKCEKGGGHLVIIRDLATQNFLYNTMLNEFHYDGAVWIGLSDQAYEGTFVWVDGTPAEFTYWASGQPGIMGGIQDCVAMDIRDGGWWNDYRCRDFLFVHNRHTFVCEYPVVKTTPGWTTATPGSTTATPGSTTATPGPTTAMPGSTTATPGSTTATPGSTTATPASTTATPGSTTATPGSTTATPGSTTATPASTTATRAPTTATPGSTTTTPGPTTAMPASTTATPAPTTATPGPTTAMPAPTTATPGPTITTPKPITPSASSGTTACPPFNCSQDCGLSGYKVDENSCLLCECED